MREKRLEGFSVTSPNETIMSTKLNEKQLIAVHLIASGVKASLIAKQIGIREETLSRWRQNDNFNKAVQDATAFILREIIDTHKNLLITSQSIISNALNNEELDLFKKANIALRYLSLMKGKDDLLEQSKRQLSSYQFDNRLNVF